MKYLTNTSQVIKILFFIVIAVVIILPFLLPETVSAINLESAKQAATKAGFNTQAETFGDIIILILNAILAVALLLAVVFVVISGYQMVTSRGNEEQVTHAKRGLLWSVLGAIVIVFAWAILAFAIRLAQTGSAGT